MYDIFIFAGEASADLYGSLLIKELRELSKEKSPLKIAAVGGPKIREQAIDNILYPMEGFQTMGFLDILISIPSLLIKFLKIKNFILNERPKIVIFIDFPDFSLKMEKSLKKSGFEGKIIHYVSPSVWAWRENRIAHMEKYVDILLTILPFEEEFFKKKSSIKSIYVGHPVISQVHNILPSAKDHMPSAKDTRLPSAKDPRLPSAKDPDAKDPGLLSAKDIVGIFPGSRAAVIKKNLPTQLKAIKKILENNNTKSTNIGSLLLFASNDTHIPLIKKIVDSVGIKVEITKDEKRISELSLAVATSGTITLQLAINKIPTIVTYAINSLDLIIAQKILKIPSMRFYSIVNLLAQKDFESETPKIFTNVAPPGEIFPELFGHNFTEENIISKFNFFLGNTTQKKSCQAGCKKIISLLQVEECPSTKVAKVIMENLS